MRPHDDQYGKDNLSRGRSIMDAYGISLKYAVMLYANLESVYTYKCTKTPYSNYNENAFR